MDSVFALWCIWIPPFFSRSNNQKHESLYLHPLRARLTPLNVCLHMCSSFITIFTQFNLYSSSFLWFSSSKSPGLTYIIRHIRQGIWKTQSLYNLSFYFTWNARFRNIEIQQLDFTTFLIVFVFGQISDKNLKERRPNRQWSSFGRLFYVGSLNAASLAPRCIHFRETRLFIHKDGDAGSETGSSRRFQFRKLQEVKAFIKHNLGRFLDNVKQHTVLLFSPG